MDFKNVSPLLKDIAAEYRFRETPVGVLWLREQITKILRAIIDFLSNLKIPLPGGSDSRAAADLLQFFLILAGVVCAIVVTFLLARRMSQIKKSGQTQLPLASDLPLDRKGFKDHARAMRESGNYRESVRSLYMSALYLLDERGIINFSPTRTNFEYFYSLGAPSLSELQKTFRELVDRVESIWFGFAHCDDTDYSRCLELLENLEKTNHTAGSIR